MVATLFKIFCRNINKLIAMNLVCNGLPRSVVEDY